jgi:hypothetical protein
MELETDSTLNFLDVKICRSDGGFEFGIYRKPTQTDLVIPMESNHPYQYKMAAFRSMVYRLLTYQLSSQEYNKEVLIIKQIAHNNGYDHSLIDNIIRKTKYKLIKQDRTESKEKKFVPFGFVNKYSISVGNVLKKNGYHPGYKLNRINLNKTKVCDKSRERGVYQIECNSGAKCGKKYIGYTNRSFFERFKEHNAVNQSNPTSKVAQHLKENRQHKINFDQSLTVLKKCSDKNKAQVWEELFIYKNFSKNGREIMLNKKEEYSDKITYRLYCSLDNNKNCSNNPQSADSRMT